MADLKTIIKITQTAEQRERQAEQLILSAVDALKPREADVLRRRYGLRPQGSETLQQIGEEFGITRERVRQIEAQGIKNFQAQLSAAPLVDLVKLAEALVRENGGAAAQRILFQLLLPESQRTEIGERSVAFLLEQIPSIELHSETKPFRAFYATSKAYAASVQKLEPILVTLLEKAGKPVASAALATQAAEHKGTEGVRYLLTPELTVATLEISTRFVETPAGDWGLASWSNINPRNIRDKTLYILKQSGTPLHFQDIADKITAAKFDHKRVTAQAVHNELINGSEFVLIGRGIYALKEWGYVPGTVADVIKTVLGKASEPMDREAIVEEVLKQRHVSRNTILINLQEKTLFNRVGKHAYELVGGPQQTTT